MKKVIINRGIPGSGKSTGADEAQYAVPEKDCKIVSSDLYPGLYDENGGFHPELLSKSHPWCMGEFIHALMEGKSLVIVDNTNTQAHEISPYVLVAQYFAYEIEIWRYDAGSIDEAFERNTHKVPLEVCTRMHNQLVQPLPYHFPKERIIYTGQETMLHG
jgi:predicted kinase